MLFRSMSEVDLKSLIAGSFRPVPNNTPWWKTMYEDYPDSVITQYLKQTEEFILANDGRRPVMATVTRNVNLLGVDHAPYEGWTDIDDRRIKRWLTQCVGI